MFILRLFQVIETECVEPTKLTRTRHGYSRLRTQAQMSLYIVLCRVWVLPLFQDRMWVVPVVLQSIKSVDFISVFLMEFPQIITECGYRMLHFWFITEGIWDS